SLSGTSMATPHVAGEAALIWSQNPSLTNVQVKSLITSNVDGYTPYSGRTITAGAARINVYNALLAAGTLSPPPAPASLTATAGNAQVTHAWSASAGASSYNVKRATVSGGPYTTIASSISATSYTDAGLTSGVTYYYVVSAVNAGGESANSAQASATPLAPAPTNLVASAGNAKVSLSWKASAGAASYNVKRATVSGGPYATIASN